MDSAHPLGDVVVLGLGKTGICVADYLAGQLGGRVTSVTLYGGLKAAQSDASLELEQKGVHVVYGSESIEGLYDLAIASPGIPEHSSFFQSARLHANEVIGEPEFAFRESPSRWVAITGTNGKTTTTLLVTELLQVGGLVATAVGNVGTVATGEVAKRPDGSWFVAELSSFQLATASSIRPRVACMLNVTPDHLEWHGSMDAYAAAKERVFAQMGGEDLAVVSVDDEWCRAVAGRLERRGVRVCRVSVHGEPDTRNAAFVRDDRLVIRNEGTEHVLILAKSLSIRGDHNIQNALAAASVAVELGVSEDAVSHGLLSFHPLEHRIEPCGSIGGVRFVNDSKATNVDSVEKALTAFLPGKVIVLLGGHDKGTTLDTLAHAVSSRCKAAVCYGEAGPRIAEALRAEDGNMGLVVMQAPHMQEALAQARKLAVPNDVVLLSPACSSFDEFTSYQQRGTRFKELVANAISEEGETDE